MMKVPLGSDLTTIWVKELVYEPTLKISPVVGSTPTSVGPCNLSGESDFLMGRIWDK